MFTKENVLGNFRYDVLNSGKNTNLLPRKVDCYFRGASLRALNFLQNCLEMPAQEDLAHLVGLSFKVEALRDLLQVGNKDIYVQTAKGAVVLDMLTGILPPSDEGRIESLEDLCRVFTRRASDESTHSQSCTIMVEGHSSRAWSAIVQENEFRGNAKASQEIEIVQNTVRLLARYCQAVQNNMPVYLDDPQEGRLTFAQYYQGFYNEPLPEVKQAPTHALSL